LHHLGFCKPLAVGAAGLTLLALAGCTSSSGSPQPQPLPQGLSVFVGTPSGFGCLDGKGAAARLGGPTAMALDPQSGNIYVADFGNNLLRKVTFSGGAASVSTYAGIAGNATETDGPLGSATFEEPRTVAYDTLGNLYVGDLFYLRLVSGGQVASLTGLWDPCCLVPAGGPGNLFYSSVTQIQKVTVGYAATPPTLAVVTTWGQTTAGAVAVGGATTAKFYAPYGLAFDGSRMLYVADTGNATIRAIDTTTNLISTVAGLAAGYQTVDGTGSAARFEAPTGLVLDASGDLIVSDSLDNIIRKVTLSGGVGTVSTLAGIPGNRGGDDGVGKGATLADPTGLGRDSSGNLYVACNWDGGLRRIAPDGTVTTITNIYDWGSGSVFGNLAVDASGNIYGGLTVNGVIFKVAPDGVATTLTAGWKAPGAVALDGSGNLYWPDSHDQVIYQLTPGGTPSVLAGSVGTSGSTDNPPLFNGPIGLALDAAGHIHVADTGNNTIRKITLTPVKGGAPTVTVTTLAGTALQAGSTDSPALFNQPRNLAVDPQGNLLVTDYGNGLVRKVTPTGTVTTVAGQAGKMAIFPGPLPAILARPTGTAVDPSTGNVFVTVPYAVMAVVF
jgi:sugar lactone lactonase YvrE